MAEPDWMQLPADDEPFDGYESDSTIIDEEPLAEFITPPEPADAFVETATEMIEDTIKSRNYVPAPSPRIPAPAAMASAAMAPAAMAPPAEHIAPEVLQLSEEPGDELPLADPEPPLALPPNTNALNAVMTEEARREQELVDAMPPLHPDAIVKLESYAHLKFPDATFHLTTLNLTIGRDCHAIRTILESFRKLRRARQVTNGAAAAPSGAASSDTAPVQNISRPFVSLEAGFLGPTQAEIEALGLTQAEIEAQARRRAIRDKGKQPSHNSGGSSAKSSITVGGDGSQDGDGLPASGNPHSADGADNEARSHALAAIEQVERQYISNNPPTPFQLLQVDQAAPDQRVSYLGIHSSGPDIVRKSRSISRRHMQIRFDKNLSVFKAVPIHRNGFFVNEVFATGPVVLRSGDRLQIKDVEFSFFISRAGRGCTGAEGGGKGMTFDFSGADEDAAAARDTSEDEAGPSGYTADGAASAAAVGASAAAATAAVPANYVNGAAPPSNALSARKGSAPTVRTNGKSGAAADAAAAPPAADISLEAQAAIASVVLDPQPDGPPRKRGPGRPPKNGLFSLRQMKERLEDQTLSPEQRKQLEAQYQLLKQKKKTPKAQQASSSKAPQQQQAPSHQPGPAGQEQRQLPPQQQQTPSQPDAEGQQLSMPLPQQGDHQPGPNGEQQLPSQALLQQDMAAPLSLAAADPFGQPWYPQMADESQQLGLQLNTEPEAVGGPLLAGTRLDDTLSPTMTHKLLQLQASMQNSSTHNDGQLFQAPLEQQQPQVPGQLAYDAYAQNLEPLQALDDANGGGGGGGQPEFPLPLPGSADFASTAVALGEAGASAEATIQVGSGLLPSGGLSADGTTPTKRKVGRPRKHPLPENADERPEKRRYKQRKPRSGDEEEGSDNAERERSAGGGSSAETAQRRLERHKTPPLQLRREDYSEDQLAKPAKSYSVLIDEVLQEAAPQGLSLKQIYKRIQLKYVFYHFIVETKGWESSVRHNLIGNVAFAKDESTQLWHRVPGVELDAGKKARKGNSPERTLSSGSSGNPNGLATSHAATTTGTSSSSLEFMSYGNIRYHSPQQPQQQALPPVPHAQLALPAHVQQQNGFSQTPASLPYSQQHLPQAFQQQQQPQALPGHNSFPGLPTTTVAGQPAQNGVVASMVAAQMLPRTLGPAPGLPPSMATPASLSPSARTTPPAIGYGLPSGTAMPASTAAAASLPPAALAASAAASSSASATPSPPRVLPPAVPQWLVHLVGALKAQVLTQTQEMELAEEAVMSAVNRVFGLSTTCLVPASMQQLEQVVYSVFRESLVSHAKAEDAQQQQASVAAAAAAATAAARAGTAGTAGTTPPPEGGVAPTTLDPRLVAVLLRFKERMKADLDGIADLTAERTEALSLSAINRVLGFTDRSMVLSEGHEAAQLEHTEANIFVPQAHMAVQAYRATLV